ncbi:MAG TPA: cell division protein FtsL [Deltaproteobacteria bacterium]|nr:cell division protein FtsL [Deltaproteobacteria bacterium]
MKLTSIHGPEVRGCERRRGFSMAHVSKRSPSKLDEGKGVKYSSLGYVSLVVMVVVLVYVWCHVQVTEVNYEMAQAIKVREQLLEENSKLKIEIERLKSPARIEDYARKKLGMDYPERNQVVVLR